MLVKSYYNHPGAAAAAATGLFYQLPQAAAPPPGGLGALTAAGTALNTHNGVPITAATSFNPAAASLLNTTGPAAAGSFNPAAAAAAMSAAGTLSLPPPPPHLTAAHHQQIQQQLSQAVSAAQPINGHHAPPPPHHHLHHPHSHHRLPQPAAAAANPLLRGVGGPSPRGRQLSQPGLQQKTSSPAAAGQLSRQAVTAGQTSPAAAAAGAAGAGGGQSSKTGPASKKFRPAYTRPSNKNSRYIPKPMPQELANLKTYSSPDILICGNCREMFSDLVDMLDHKRDYCKLRFTCKCDLLNEEECDCDASTPELFAATAATTATTAAAPNPASSSQESDSQTASAVVRTTPSTTGSSSSLMSTKPAPKKRWLHCVSCKSPFANAWDLMVHVQAAHMMNIYQLADTNKLQQQQQQMAAAAAAAADGSKDNASAETDQSSETVAPCSNVVISSEAQLLQTNEINHQDNHHPTTPSITLIQ